MSVIQKGTLIRCDIPIKQFLIYLERSQNVKFIIDSDLDDTTLLVNEETIPFIESEVKKFIDSNTDREKQGTRRKG